MQDFTETAFGIFQYILRLDTLWFQIQAYCWCDGWYACLECSRLWVQTQVGSNQIL